MSRLSTLDFRPGCVEHLVDEQPLQFHAGLTEVVAIARRARVKVDVPARRHHRLARLEREPPPPDYGDRPGIDRVLEYGSDQVDFTLGQGPFASDRAGMLVKQSAQCAASICSP